MNIAVDLLPFVLVCALPFLLYVVADGCALYLAKRRRRPLEEAYLVLNLCLDTGRVVHVAIHSAPGGCIGAFTPQGCSAYGDTLGEAFDSLRASLPTIAYGFARKDTPLHDAFLRVSKRESGAVYYRGALSPEELDDLAKVGITIVQHPA